VDARKLREVAGYHAGTDLVERIKSCVYTQDVQKAALLEAADRIEELERLLGAAELCGMCHRRRLPKEGSDENAC